MAIEPLSVVVHGAALRRPRRVRRLRWIALLLVSPSVVFPFAWAALTWTVLWLEQRYLDARHALRGSAPSGRVLRLDQDALSVTLRWDRFELRRGDVIEGWLEPATPSSQRPSAAEDGSVVALRARDGRLLYLLVEDEARAREVLEAMGVGPLQQLLRVRLGSHASQAGEGVVFHLLGPLLMAFVSFAPVVLALAALLDGSALGILVGVAVLALTAAAWAGLFRYNSAGTAVVGADGVAIEYPLRRTRFLPHSRITDIRADERGVQLWSGTTCVDLPTKSFVSESPGYARALAARIRHARDEALTRKAVDAAKPKLESLDRGGRTVSAWKEELSRVAADAGDYRRVAFAPEELAAVVEDPTAPPERRVAAALALGKRGGEEATRARVAAAACAHAPLRIAIESALDGEADEEEVERALATR